MKGFGSRVYQEPLLEAFQYHRQWLGGSRLHDPIPTSAVLDPGLQQCAESVLDMILAYVPLLAPHFLFSIIQGGTKKHFNRGGLLVEVQRGHKKIAKLHQHPRICNGTWIPAFWHPVFQWSGL